MPPAACFRLCSRDSACVDEFARSTISGLHEGKDDLVCGNKFHIDSVIC